MSRINFFRRKSTILVFTALLFAVSIAFGTIGLSASSEDTLIKQENKIFVPQLSDTSFLLAGNSINGTSNGFSLENNLSPVTTLGVTNLNDSGAGSLRQAIIDANSNIGDDTIIFQNGLSGTITLTSGELLINSNITIDGVSADVISVSGNSLSRVFNITTNTVVRINNLTITGGFVPQPQNSSECGCGLLNAGNLNVSNTKITGNSTTSSNGGCGLGFANTGTMVLSNSTVSNNIGFAAITGRSVSGGGINNIGTLSITNSTISSNVGRFGGGIYTNGNTTVTNSTIYGNQTGNNSIGRAGGIYQGGGSLVLRNSTVASNSSPTDIGGISSKHSSKSIII